MSDRNIKAFRTLTLADVDDRTSCVELSELEDGGLRFATGGDIRHGGSFDVPPEALAGLVDLVAPGHREALAVLSKLVERAQKVADGIPGDRTFDRLLNMASAVEVPAAIFREALDVLKKAGVR